MMHQIAGDKIKNVYPMECINMFVKKSRKMATNPMPNVADCAIKMASFVGHIETPGRNKYIYYLKRA